MKNKAMRTDGIKNSITGAVGGAVIGSFFGIVGSIAGSVGGAFIGFITTPKRNIENKNTHYTQVPYNQTKAVN